MSICKNLNLGLVMWDTEETFEQVCEITPPYLKHISLIKFSPSGRHLLIGNESGQYFYIYELWPETKRRHTNYQELG